MLIDPIASGIDAVAGLLGANSLETGLIATGILLVWRGQRILAWLEAGLKTLRIGFIAAGVVVLVVLLAIGADWISISSLPGLSWLLSGCHQTVHTVVDFRTP